MKSSLFINSHALKSFALFLLFSLFSLNSFSQTPSTTPTGDPAGSQFTLPTHLTAVCNPVAWNGNFLSGQYWNPTDGTCGSTVAVDIWGWFDASATSTTVTYASGGNSIIHIFDGGVGGATPTNAGTASIACANAGGNGFTETAVFPTVIGNRYRIRIQLTGGFPTGTICVYNGISGPANDDCANAEVIDCSTNNLAGTTVGASTLDSFFTGCGLGYVGVWYTFTGDGQEWTISSTGSGGFDHEMAISEGTCAGLTRLGCLDDSGADGLETYTFITTNGSTYYVYIADWFSGATVEGDFTISVSCAAAPPPPTNDDPCTAALLTVNGDYLCGTVTAGSVSNATDTGINDCLGVENNDVWFYFQAGISAHTVDILNVSAGVDMNHAVFGPFNDVSSPNCIPANVSAAHQYCSDPNSSVANGLVAGQYYFVQVNTYFLNTSSATFDVCIGSPPPPPANNSPCGAVALTVNADLACGTVTSGTVLSALETTGLNGCNGDSDDDVWYSFVATSTSHVIAISNILGSSTDLNHAVYGPFASAAACAPATVAGAAIINCSDFNNSITGGLIPGQTYFVQVYTDATGDFNTTFDICVGTPPTVVNDEPCGATVLTVNPDFLCAVTTSGTVEWSTDSTMTACAGVSDDDVWYSFTATSITHSINLLNISGPTLDMVIGIYDGGSCANATVNANNLVCSTTEAATFTTVIGNTYFVQIYTQNGSANPITAFDICVGTPPPPPTNDDPCGASLLTVNQACIPNTGSVASAGNSGIDACAGTPTNDVWFYFRATSTNHTVTIENIFGSTTNMYHAVYGGYGGPGGCSAIVVGDNVMCSDNNVSNLSGLTINDYYFVQVFTNTTTPGQTTTFDICVTEPCSNLGILNDIPTACPLIGGATGSNPFVVTPFNPDPIASINCLTDTVTLEAYSTIKETDSYIVEQIPNPASTDYAPPGFSIPALVPFDDRWADQRTNIPFNFCYYGNTYNELLVGSNGQITFDPANSPNTYNSWQINNNAPGTAGALYNNSIYAVMQDLYPVGMSNPVRTWVEGSAPCRTFTVAFVNIPLYGGGGETFTGKTVLYETSNIIEIYIHHKHLENNNVNPWNGGNAAVGIQGVGEAVIPPCRNALDDNWEATNEAWRFVPTGTTIAPTTVTWFDSLGTNIGTGNTINVNVEDTYLVEANYTVCGTAISLTDNIVVGKSEKTWTGATDTNWYEASNWFPALVPTAADCILIPDTSSGSNRYPIADISNTAPLPPQPGYALNLTVDVGATLDVLSGTNLVVTDYITNDGVINIQDTASLIQINDGAVNVNNNNGSGYMTMERTVSSVGSYDYIYWSSPVESFTVGNVSPGSSFIYEWEPTIAANLNGYGDWLPASGNMQKGKGYIIRNIIGTATPLTPVFLGKPNNGIITSTITRGTYEGGGYFTPSGAIATRIDDNWNLVGNPYPSAISSRDFIIRNATNNTEPRVIAGSIYLWRHLTAPSNLETDPFYGDFIYNYNPNDYITVNSTGSTPSGFNGAIAAGQAFFVLMRPTVPTTSSIVFNNSMRNETLDNTQFYRTTDSDESTTEDVKNRIWLDLISPNNLANAILVGYVDGATDDFDDLYDANELSETSTRFYSIIDDSQLAIQGKALPFDDNDTVPLGIDIPQDGNYTIAINTLDGLFLDTNQDIYLEDTYNGIIHDLRVNPFSFNAEVGIYEDRFVLRYNNESLGIDEFNTSSLEIIAPNNAYVKITSGNSSISSVTLYDLLGRVIIDKREINNSEFILQTTNYSDGPYIVKAVLIDGKQKLQKVVIKN